MSLDVWLTLPGTGQEAREAIFVREDGRVKEITRKEWDRKHPGIEPVTVQKEAVANAEVFSYNITHNLGAMARAAGIYQHLWRPDELGITKAEDLIIPLRDGLELLKSDPDHFKVHDAPNGWGVYADLVKFVSAYLKACATYPEAKIGVWR